MVNDVLIIIRPYSQHFLGNNSYLAVLKKLMKREIKFLMSSLYPLSKCKCQEKLQSNSISDTDTIETFQL